MISDPKAIQGKIAALQPGFELMSEMTGKAPTASLMGFHVEHYIACHLAMDTVNRAILAIMTGWNRPYWPAPEVIAARAQEIARTERLAAFSPHDRAQEIEEACAIADARKWEHRLQMANDWRTSNAARFPTLLRRVDTDNLAVKHLVWLAESAVYRKAFRDGAVVQACNTQAGIDERRTRAIQDRERAQRASAFAATPITSDLSVA